MINPHNTTQASLHPLAFFTSEPMTLKLALDRSSVRRVDVDGRLHVAMSNISMSTVNPYFGKEIPGHESLCLEPDRVYMLLRDPGELAKAASTFNSIPVLIRHVPVTADDHQPDLVVGSTGTDAVFEAPYLKNSMVVWSSVAIAGIESGEQQQLSCAYRYTPDMTPGVYEGAAFDGVMRDIQANHLAIVEIGRTGPAVVVSDANPFIKPQTENPPMKNPKRVARLTAALIAGLSPLMALDASIKPDEFAGKLALALDAAEPDEDDKKKPAEDSDEQGPDESDEDYKKRMAEKDKPAEDEDEDDKDKDKDDKPAAKAAMDSAIARAVSAAKADTVKTMNAIRQAEKEVQPLIGEVVAQDSAEAVYKLALDHAAVDLTGVPAGAYGAMVRMLSKPAEKSPRVAMDAASTTDFAARFPTAGKLIRS